MKLTGIKGRMLCGGGKILHFVKSLLSKPQGAYFGEK